VIRVSLVVILIVVVVGCTGAAGTPVSTPSPTAGSKRATVTDLSVPFATSEADALVPRGFLGNAALGRLDGGCTVEVIKTTERAAQVKVISCPPSPNTPVPVPTGVPGWVAKSALDLKP
jgi:hypothetical protein